MAIAPFGFHDNDPTVPASSATMERLVQYLGTYTDTQDRLELAADPDNLVFGNITRDSLTGVVTSAQLRWPDGTTGTYTPTFDSTFTTSVASYTLTYGSRTYTQPTMTRNANGAVSVRPAITVS